MTKQSGVGAALLVNEFDVSGDIGAMNSISLSWNLQDDTGLDKSGTERIVLRGDAEMSYSAFWNAAVGGAIPVLEPLTEALVTFARNASVGAPTRTLTGVKSSWNATRGADGSLAATGQIQASSGRPLEGGYLLTIGKQTIASTQAISDWTTDHAYDLNDLVVPTSANGHYYKATTAGTSDAATEPVWPTDGSTIADGPDTLVWTDQGLAPNGIDRGAGSSSDFGMAGVIHAMSIGSGTATVAIQGSTDRIAWADALVFTAVAGATSEYKQTALDATIPRYLRVNVTGTFTDLVAVVAAMPYRSDQSV